MNTLYPRLPQELVDFCNYIHLLEQQNVDLGKRGRY